MKLRMLAALALFALALGGCARSISDSGFPGAGPWARNPFYQGELNEMDLIGGRPVGITAAAEIAAALAAPEPVRARRGGALLVVQSGAMIPDEPMSLALRKYFDVAPFSGIPPRDNGNLAAARENFGDQLRLAAAQGGYRQVFVYWGVLETARRDVPTKAISWVPIVGAFVPDETQRMRIRLKGLLIDVASGRWRMLLPPEIEDAALSAGTNRESSDQGQVAALKVLGYTRLAEMLAASSIE